MSKPKGLRVIGLKAAFSKVNKEKVCELKTHRKCLGFTFKTMKVCYWCNLQKGQVGRSFLVKEPVRRANTAGELKSQYKNLL